MTLWKIELQQLILFLKQKLKNVTHVTLHREDVALVPKVYNTVDKNKDKMAESMQQE